jgi:hypothetical protein
LVCHHLRKEDEKHAGDTPTFHDIANSYALAAASDMNAIIWKPSKTDENKNLRTIKLQGRFLEEEAEFSFRKVGNQFEVSDAPTKKNSNDKILQDILDNPGWNELSLRQLEEVSGYSKSVIGRFRKEFPQDDMIFQSFGKRA